MRSKRFLKYYVFILIITILLMGCGAPATPESSPESISQPSSTPVPSDTPAPTDTPLPTSTPAPTDTPEPTATSTPTFTPTPVIIRLEADGSGDYETLEEAVRSALEGATIELGAGVFRLEDSLELNKTLSLVGQGMDETEIISDAENSVVNITEGVSFSANGITFRHEGNAVADVLDVESGEVTLSNCRFTGAFSDAVEIIGGAGLRLGIESSGLVQDCVSEDNIVGMFVISGVIVLEGNTIQNNGTGIGFEGDSDSASVARGNLVSGNQRNGIFVAESAKPTLEENEISNNGWNGIVALNQSEPSIEGNIITANGKFGIAISENAKGELIKNQVSKNKFSGILIEVEAKAFLEENVCSENVFVGIWFRHNSSGTAIHNQCIGNKFGISVAASANPELVENDCHDNKVADIKDDRE